MKKWGRIILIVVYIVILSGCGTSKVKETTTYTKSNIEGQWKVEEIEGSNLEGSNIKNLVGSILSFSNEEVILFDKVYDNIKYKAKIVDLNQYLYNTLGYIPGYINKDDKNIKVITISANNTFIKDIMIIEDSVYIIEDNIIFNLIQTDKKPMDTINETKKSKKSDEYYNLDSGVLLGLRSEGNDGTEYRTAWIYFQDGNVKAAELPYLLLPRKSGFFKVTNKREYNADNYFKDSIVFTDLKGKSNEFKSTDNVLINNLIDIESDVQSTDIKNVYSNINVDKDITFIGNDYMSTKTVIYNENQNQGFLNTYMLDMNRLGNNSSVALGTLSESNDINSKILTEDKEKDMNNFTNFAIKRKQGRWGFYTFTSSDNKLLDELRDQKESDSNGYEFNDCDDKRDKIDITLRVSENIARYDKIFMPWQGIQKQVPSAIDAISSPNKNLAIIKTKTNLYIYKIVNNNLEEEPSLTIPLWGKEAIVMSEWAEGDYVGYWTEEVKSLSAVDVEN